MIHGHDLILKTGSMKKIRITCACRSFSVLVLNYLCHPFDQSYFKDLSNTAFTMAKTFKLNKNRIKIIKVLADDRGHAHSDLMKELKKNDKDAGNLLKSLNTMVSRGILRKSESLKRSKTGQNKKVAPYYIERNVVLLREIRDYFKENANTEDLNGFLDSEYVKAMVDANPELKSEIKKYVPGCPNPKQIESTSSPDQSNSSKLVTQTTSNKNAENVQPISSDNKTSLHSSIPKMIDTILKDPIRRDSINDILINLRGICQKELKNSTFDESTKKKIALMLMDIAVSNMNGRMTKILDVLNESDVVLYPIEEWYEVANDIDLVNARETLFDIIEMLDVRDRCILDKCIHFVCDALIAENDRDNRIEGEAMNPDFFGTNPGDSHPVGMTHYRVGVWLAKNPNQKKELIDKVTESVLSSPESKRYGTKFIAHIS